MRHTEIIKREDGSVVKIDIYFGETNNEGWYRSYVRTQVAESKGWKWELQPFPLTDNIVTPAEIHAAKLKCWEKLKP